MADFHTIVAQVKNGPQRLPPERVPHDCQRQVGLGRLDLGADKVHVLSSGPLQLSRVQAHHLAAVVREGLEARNEQFAHVVAAAPQCTQTPTALQELVRAGPQDRDALPVSPPSACEEVDAQIGR